MQPLLEVGADQRDGRAEGFRGAAGVRVEAREVRFVEARRGGECGEGGNVGLHLAVEGEGEGLGG